TDICLITMPYASLERPSLPLGLLDNYISAFGHQVDVIYGNLKFAKMLGIDKFYNVESANNEALAGEWTFSRAAFPDKNHDDTGYFDLLDFAPTSRENLLAIRQTAEQFIDELAVEILAKNPKIVGCSSTFQQNCASLALLRQIKAKRPDIITLMGGANCEGIMGQTISDCFDWVDYVFSGESDEVIGDFFNQLMQGVNFDAHNLPYGVITKKTNTIPIATKSDTVDKKPPRAFVEDMKNVGSPTYDSYFSTIKALGFEQQIKPGLMVETSRGCWWGAKRHCTFCGLNGHGMVYRAKDAETALNEFAQLSEKYQVDKFGLVDNILPMEYMDTVLPQLAERSEQHQFSLFYETKANLRKEHVVKLADAGVKWIQPGLENLHDDVLKLMKKGTNAVQNVATLKWCRESGVRVSWTILFGSPGEQQQWYSDMAQWIPLVAHLQPPQQQMSKIGYHRFSPYFDKAHEYDLNLAPIKPYQHIYDLNDTDLFNIAYFFQEQTTDAPVTNSVDDNSLAHLPGHQAMQTAVTHWSQQFWCGQVPPLLCMFDETAHIRILDTRKVATKLAHRLEGVTAQVYRLCVGPISKERLIEKLADTGETLLTSDVDGILQQLIDDKLMLHVSHCYLSLALSGELPQLPNSADYPSGYLSLNEGSNGWKVMGI
ncbi:MAG: RiPP maturation radical SAM protein 1, partial [Algicola sp.]|nr:RiPP maturation radical SAM protein 1 [Algicola sp.]